jgi:hypothetical protein
VLPFLESLDATRLNAEQQQRVRQLCKSLNTDTEDVPHRVAVWLAGDARLWTSLATANASTGLTQRAQQFLSGETHASKLASAESETQQP